MSHKAAERKREGRTPLITHREGGGGTKKNPQTTQTALFPLQPRLRRAPSHPTPPKKNRKTTLPGAPPHHGATKRHPRGGGRGSGGPRPAGLGWVVAEGLPRGVGLPEGKLGWVARGVRKKKPRP